MKIIDYIKLGCIAKKETQWVSSRKSQLVSVLSGLILSFTVIDNAAYASQEVASVSNVKAVSTLSAESGEENNGVVDINTLSGPEKAVWDATQTLLEIIDEERGDYQANPTRFYERVTEALRPVVGFKRIAAMVMGSYYKKASKKQKAEFSILFERSLVETYSGGLIEYDGYSIQILPGAPIASGKRKAVVNITITTSSGTQVPLKYSMYKTKSGKWKVQNVTVAGINVGLLYRQQFARKVAEAGGDLGVVISQWSSRLDVEVEGGQLKTELTDQKK